MTLRQYLRTDEYAAIKKMILSKNDFNDLVGAIFNTSRAGHDFIILQEMVDVLDREFHTDYNRFITYEECFVLKSILWFAAPNDEKEDNVEWDYSLQRAYWRKLVYKLSLQR
jgi:hypothetical protein